MAASIDVDVGSCADMSTTGRLDSKVMIAGLAPMGKFYQRVCAAEAMVAVVPVFLSGVMRMQALKCPIGESASSRCG